MSADETALRERLAGVLAEHHAIVSGDDDGWYVVCTCGHRERGTDVDAHLADALLPVVAQEVAAARGEVVTKVEAALANHPDACDRYDDEDVIKCGWKSAVIDVRRALDGDR